MLSLCIKKFPQKVCYQQRIESLHSLLFEKNTRTQQNPLGNNPQCKSANLPTHLPNLICVLSMYLLLFFLLSEKCRWIVFWHQENFIFQPSRFSLLDAFPSPRSSRNAGCRITESKGSRVLDFQMKIPWQIFFTQFHPKSAIRMKYLRKHTETHFRYFLQLIASRHKLYIFSNSISHKFTILDSGDYKSLVFTKFHHCLTKFLINSQPWGTCPKYVHRSLNR